MFDRETVVEKVKNIFNENFGNTNIDLVDVKYAKEGRDMVLRILVDKKGGITIDECGDISNKLSFSLDEIDLISDYYVLEVSSPGLDRPLKTPNDFLRHTDEEVYVHTMIPVNEKTQFLGKILDAKDGKVMLSVNGKETQVDLDNIVKAVLKLDF